MKAYAYIRVSTDGQVEKFGLPVQREEIIKYAKEHDIEIVAWYEDDGISGKTPERPGLQDMFAALNDCPVDSVIVLNVSRLWRSDLCGGIVRYTISQSHADIISVQEPNYSLYTEDPSDYLINSIFQALAVYDRMNINIKLRTARRHKGKKGDKPCGTANLGYTWEKGAIVPDKNADMVRDMFVAYSNNKSYAALQRYCKQRGYKTIHNKDFSRQSLKNIITNKFYIGVTTYNNESVAGNHIAIIDRDLFELCQS